MSDSAESTFHISTNLIFPNVKGTLILLPIPSSLLVRELKHRKI